MLMLRIMKGLLLLLVSNILLVSSKDTHELVIETEAGQTFDALCPTKNYVAGVTLTRVTLSGNLTDFKFSVLCRPLIGSVLKTVGEETCTVLLPIPLLYYDLSFDDYEYNCECNEYLVGIRSEHFGHAWDGPAKGPERRIQLICCKADNIYVNNAQCGYTGMESLLGSPWRDADIGAARMTGLKEQVVIQGLTLSYNYINSRVCVVEPWLSGKAFDNSECYEYGDCNDAGGKHVGNVGHSGILDNGRQCYRHENEPFGWSESMTYVGGESVATYRNSQWYQKQEFVCRSGQRISSVGFTPRKPDSNHKNADHIFNVKCTSNNGVFPCYCYWMNDCPAKSINEFYGDIDGAWYISGVRNWWDSSRKQRKIEYLCCQTDGLKILDCSDSDSISSSNSFNLDDDKSAPENGDHDSPTIKIVRNINTVYSNSKLALKINTCHAQLTYEWCNDDYDAQCHRCKRRKRSKNQRQLPEANGAGQQQSNSNSGGSQRNSNYRALFTDRGSSGWGPIWWSRPIYSYSNSKESGGRPGTVSAPPACSYKPKCGNSCPKNVKLPGHGHGYASQPSSGPVPPDNPTGPNAGKTKEATSKNSGDSTKGTDQKGKASNAGRTINQYHAGTGRGGNPVGPNVQQFHGVNTGSFGNNVNIGNMGSNSGSFSNAVRMANQFSRMASSAAHYAPAAFHAAGAASHVAPAVAHVAPAAAHVAPAAAHVAPAVAHVAPAAIGHIPFGKK